MRTQRTATAARRIGRGARDLCRLASQSIRALPDFLIVGAQKCGTTSLFKHVVAHPGVMAPLTKEVHYFDRHYGRGIEWYRAHFPLRARLAGRLTGEASPSYMYFAPAARRMAEALPDARLIVLLRNPVDRAFSHYRMKRDRRIETLSFEEAIDAEPTRVPGEPGPDDVLDDPRRHFSYLGRGRYVEQLEEIGRHIPRERVLVLKSEDLFAGEGAALEDLSRFLGLEGLAVETLRRSNQGRGHGGLEPDLRRRLEEYFEPYNQRLYEHLGRDLGW